MRGISADRRKAPRDDIVSMLLKSEIELDGVRETIDERHLLGLINNLLPAGAGTTYRSLGILLVTLLERPELLESLYRNRDRIPRVKLGRASGRERVGPYVSISGAAVTLKKKH